MKWITELKENTVFVYGANLAGIHGAGAAHQALQWGAEYGKIGFRGQTYGIPTKDFDLNTMSIDRIKPYIDRFIKFAIIMNDLTFLVTPIGTGLAGPAKDIAPLFQEAIGVKNIKLPEEFLRELF